MIDFNDIKYEPTDFDDIQKRINSATQKVLDASCREDVFDAISDVNSELQHIETFSEYLTVKVYADSTDETLMDEYVAFNTRASGLESAKFWDAVIASEFLPDVCKKYGDNFIKTKRENIRLEGANELKAKEAELEGEYQNLFSTITYYYDGEKIARSALRKMENDPDRNIRAKARRARLESIIAYKDQFDRILDELVKTRDGIAKELGFNDYLEYKNTYYQRYSYGKKEILDFCDLIKKEFMPLVKKINDSLKDALGLDEYTSDDTGLFSTNGNCQTKGDYVFVTEQLQKMFSDLDPFMEKLFNEMKEYHYFDLAPSDSKIPNTSGAASFYDYKIPYIIISSNDSTDFLNSFAHELGHAISFMLCMEKWELFDQQNFPQDLCEIPSKTMELVTLQYSDFFLEGAKEYRRERLTDFFEDIKNFCMLTEYEYFLYGNANATNEERIQKYQELVTQYTPGLSYKNNDLRMLGCSLYSNSGLFNFPAYTLSYSLSSIQAIYFASKIAQDKKSGIEEYKKMCSLGCSMDFYEATKNLGIPSALSAEAVIAAKDYLAQYI